jgi:hypothetical protein
MATTPRPGDPWPYKISPREWLAQNRLLLTQFEPRIGQGNFYGVTGDRLGPYLRSETAPFIEPDYTRGTPISKIFPTRNPVAPLHPSQAQPVNVTPLTPQQKYPPYRAPQLPGEGYRLGGDMNVYQPQWAYSDWERNMLHRFPIEQSRGTYGIEPLDFKAFSTEGKSLANLAQHLSPVERSAIVKRLPIQPLIQDTVAKMAPEELVATAGRAFSPAAIIPGAVGSVAAPLVINQLPISPDAKNVLTSTAEGGSLGSMGFAFGPQVGIATTALGSILGGGKALLGL